MTDLITEARELCEKATPGPWEWICDDPAFLTLGKSGAEQEYHVLSAWKCESCQKTGLNCLWPEKYDAAFIARSRTLIPELCDALEKAEAVMWIPITERLPEQHVDVLVCGTEAINNVKYLCVVKCLDGNVFRPLSAPSVTWTHWMPLPAPPENEPIVRCGECIHFEPYGGEEYKGNCNELVGLDSCMYEDDYCSYGERKPERSDG
jgi:hypothetical protein